MSDGWSSRVVRQLKRGKRISSIMLDGWRRSSSKAVSVAEGCLYTMSVHYIQGCLHSISSVSPWYLLVYVN